MKLHVLNTGYFKLDGGAMFGVVPKSLWSRTNPADQNNMCSWALRSLLIEDGERLILIDTGMGEKQSDKFFSYYYLHGDDSLDKNLNKLGFSRDDITDVFLSHLHFDHCGGAVEWNDQKNGYRPTFKNAQYWSTKNHWDWAINPNDREKASFLKEKRTTSIYRTNRSIYKKCVPKFRCVICRWSYRKYDDSSYSL